MTDTSGASAVGAHPADGLIHRRSPRSVDETVALVTTAIGRAGAEVFAVVDHSGAAQRVGLALRDTKLVLFGNPSAGTPLMQVSPAIAIDLPVKILVWTDDDGAVWMTYLSAQWLGDRHGVPPELRRPLWAPEVLTSQVVESQ